MLDTPACQQNLGALVAPLDLRSISAARDKALALAARAADTLLSGYDLMDEAAEAAKGAHHGHRCYRDQVNEQKAIARLFKDRFDAEESLSAYRRELDAAIWTRLVHETNFVKLMDAKERDTFERSMREDVPEATAENIHATFERLTQDAELMFMRGIARCFTNLDPAFKSHDCFKIGRRMIFTYAFDRWGHLQWNSSLRATLGDVERVFSQLDGNPTWGSVEMTLDRSRRGASGPMQSVVETQYFKLRGFMNGNLHLWIRPECKPLLDKVNRVLATYYGEVLPDAADRGADPADFRVTGTAVAKDLAFYPTPPEIVTLALEDFYIKPGDRILEPSAGMGAFVRPLLERGAQVDAFEIHPDRAAALEGIANPDLRVRCANFLTVLPEPVYDAAVLNPPFCGTHHLDHVRHAFDFLKPGGELIAILPVSAQHGTTPKHERFQAWVTQHMPRFRAQWRDLPPESFASLGVRINTVVLRLRKST